jgi:hypothetical protein
LIGSPTVPRICREEMSAFLHKLVAFLGNRADSRGSGVENVDLVFLNNLPETAVGRIIGNAFEHDGCCAVAQRTVKNVGVTGDPAEVGGAPVNIAIMIIENIFWV